MPVNPSAIGDGRADFADASVPAAVGACNGKASKSEAASFHYKSIHSRTVDGIPMSFAEVLRSLRDAAESDQIHLHGLAAGPAIRQACDTFTSEHPEFARRFIENGSGQILLFEKKSSLGQSGG